MKVIICGAGQVGWQIARHLSGEKSAFTIVDGNTDLIRSPPSRNSARSPISRP